MATDITKACADFLRQKHHDAYGEKLQASHAHELVASYFGYKSRAALLAEMDFPVSELEDAAILIPDVRGMEARRKTLQDLPPSLGSSASLASSLSGFLEGEGLFSGEVWLSDKIETYVMEEFLPDHDNEILDELSGVMAETNAFFDDAYYEKASVTDGGDQVVIEVNGTYSGSNDPDKPYSGDKIKMTVTVTLARVAGRTAFAGADIEAGGAIDDGYYDD